MAVSAKSIRPQLEMLKPLLSACSLDTLRKGQDMVGALMGLRQRDQVVIKEHPFARFSGHWVIPKDERRDGVILYLHGGGFTCGGADYAKGVGTSLAIWTGAKIFCAAYRLAPEHPSPAAVEDVEEAYAYLLSKGYRPEHILLCGESAGGGLCYSLCLKLQEKNMPLPAGIIGISPWVDLTLSGDSYEYNGQKDPSMSREALTFFAKNYTQDPEDPLVSPLFADLTAMPPSLLFAGGDEILLSDAQRLHTALQNAGCKSRLIVTPQRWHGYILYGLEEDQKELAAISDFLDEHFSQQRKLRWMRLDNAAKIYPAARRQNWSNVFRLSATLKEDVDTQVLQSALDVTVRRFPSIATRLRKGVFWYYLQQLDHAPAVREESSFPLTRMSRKETRQCAFRVIVYGKRIAVELFHSLTDGNGALIFLKSLVAEYLQQKYGIRIPAQDGVFSRLEEPDPEELEDIFPKFSARIAASRKENTAWRLSGTPEPDGFLNITCFRLNVRDVLNKAHEYGISLTSFLCAVMLEALQQLQKERFPDIRRRKPLKVLIPVNLRTIYPTKSMRNFALYSTPEIQTRAGQYSFEEICKIVHHWIGWDTTPHQMAMKVATNVQSEKLLVVRLLPLFLKNIIMRTIFIIAGEQKSSLCLSNLGAVRVPGEMAQYVERMDFILGSQATAPYNCGVLSYNDTLYINFTRNIKESDLEYRFFCVLRDLGLDVQVQSNRPE